MDNGSAQRARMTLAGAMCCDSRTCSLVRLSVALVLKCIRALYVLFSLCSLALCLLLRELVIVVYDCVDGCGCFAL